MNTNAGLTASFWVTIILQTIGAVDLPGKGVRKMPSPRNYVLTRIDLTNTGAGPIDFRLDARREWKMNPSQIEEEMAAFYDHLGDGTWIRETGVFVISRFAGPPVAGASTAGQGQY